MLSLGLLICRLKLKCLNFVNDCLFVINRLSRCCYVAFFASCSELERYYFDVETL